MEPSSKQRKVYDRWCASQHGVSKDELKGMMESLGCSVEEGGKHPKVTHPKFDQMPGCSGFITFALKHGRGVKPLYIKMMLDAIAFLMEDDC